MDMNMKYPYDIAAFKTKKEGRYETMSIEAHFTQEREDSPMRVFDEKFSRFTLNILSSDETTGKKSAVKINIPLEDIAEAKEISRYALHEYRFPSMVAANSNAPGDIDRTSPAFTKKFIAGNLKGKSPVDVLIENQDGRNILDKQYAWLQSNISKYPANQGLMDAISEALKLNIEELKNTGTTASSSRIATIIDIGCRPLIRKAREDGKCPVYEGKITWDTDPAQRYPVSVTVKNYYANVNQKTDGTLNVAVSSKDSEIIKTFRLSSKDWMHCIDRMALAEQAFYFSHFNRGYEAAESFARSMRECVRA